MADSMMTDLLAHVGLAFECNTEPNLHGVCALCGGDLDPDDDVRWVAVALALGTPEVGRICERCANGRQAGAWEIAEGMDHILTGMLRMPLEKRALMALQVSLFVEKLAKVD